jgi:hypothetical protein
VAQYEEAAAEQATLAQELAELYPPFAAKIVDLLLRIQKADNRATHLDFYKPKGADGLPYGDGRSPRRTEEQARVRGGGLSILKDLRLPSWIANPVTAWPPWRPLGLEVAAGYALRPRRAHPSRSPRAMPLGKKRRRGLPPTIGRGNRCAKSAKPPKRGPPKSAT